MKRVIVCVTNDLANDQRVHRTCMTLVKCNYIVTEYGRLFSDSAPLDQPYKTCRIKHWFNTSFLFYAEYNIRLFFYLLFNKADLIYANDLDTLLAAFLIAKIKRTKLIYDSHEYFTETPELKQRPLIRKVWLTIEKTLFPRLQHIITVNQSIAKLYEKKYNKKLSVIRNIPLSYHIDKIKTRKELSLPETKKIILIQGTGINKDRGAEEACLAMQYIEEAILLIIGKGDVIPKLKEIIADKQLENKIILLNKLPREELKHYTLNADLGLAIDKNTNDNYLYALPNKLFDFIHANIPVLCSRLIEISYVIDHYDIGFYIENHQPEHIANRINTIFAEAENYLLKKNNTFKAKEELCWEIEEKKLIDIIHAMTI